jgi:hypothetical protein
MRSVSFCSEHQHSRATAFPTFQFSPSLADGSIPFSRRARIAESEERRHDLRIAVSRRRNLPIVARPISDRPKSARFQRSARRQVTARFPRIARLPTIASRRMTENRPMTESLLIR